MIRHIIFDLDGTLVDSDLDFDRMRREMGLADDAPILETLAELPPEEARRGWEIVQRHELAGARRAVPFPGAVSFLQALQSLDVRLAVLTRNSRSSAEAMLQHLPLSFDAVLTRDEGPIKPDPQAVWGVCRGWEVAATQTALVGDSRFDIETGRRAGARTVLFTRGRDAQKLACAGQADYLLSSFHDVENFLAWLRQPV